MRHHLCYSYRIICAADARFSISVRSAGARAQMTSGTCCHVDVSFHWLRYQLYRDIRTGYCRSIIISVNSRKKCNCTCEGCNHMRGMFISVCEKKHSFHVCSMQSFHVCRTRFQQKLPANRCHTRNTSPKQEKSRMFSCAIFRRGDTPLG